jgi:hypothetical protein
MLRSKKEVETGERQDVTAARSELTGRESLSACLTVIVVLIMLAH